MSEWLHDFFITGGGMECAMPTYSPERKAAVMNKLLPTENGTVVTVAKAEGLSEQTLYNWLKKARHEGAVVPGSGKRTSDNWSGEAKFAVVLESASLNETELGECCRRKGLCKEQIAQWRGNPPENQPHWCLMSA